MGWKRFCVHVKLFQHFDRQQRREKLVEVITHFQSRVDGENVEILVVPLHHI
jgi:hypothetical protein